MLKLIKTLTCAVDSKHLYVSRMLSPSPPLSPPRSPSPPLSLPLPLSSSLFLSHLISSHTHTHTHTRTHTHTHNAISCCMNIYMACLSWLTSPTDLQVLQTYKSYRPTSPTDLQVQPLSFKMRLFINSIYIHQCLYSRIPPSFTQVN